MNSLKINPSVDQLHDVMNFIHEQVPNKDIKLDLVIEEIFVNIVNYSKADFVKINADYSDDSIMSIEFIDNGVEFNPLEQESPDFPECIEEASVGGLGIFFVKNFADELSYDYIDGENHFKIIKSID